MPIYRLLKPISGAQQVLLDEVQTHIKQQGLEAISGLKGESVSWFKNWFNLRVRLFGPNNLAEVLQIWLIIQWTLVIVNA